MEGLVKLRLTRVSGVNETLRLVVQMVICGHYKKSCLPGRTWSSAVVDGYHPARIFGPPWPIRKLFFFVFEALYSHGLGQNVADGRPARGR